MNSIMSVQQCSQYLGMSRTKIYGLVKKYKIPATRIGAKIVFSKDLIDKWIMSSRIDGAVVRSQV